MCMSFILFTHRKTNGVAVEKDLLGVALEIDLFKLYRSDRPENEMEPILSLKFQKISVYKKKRRNEKKRLKL